MDAKKVLEVISVYRNHFESLKLNKIDFKHQAFVPDLPRKMEDRLTLGHCYGMLDQMEKFVAEGRMEKVFRWLGFIQGCLWSAGHYNLEELKNQNRPDGNAGK